MSDTSNPETNQSSIDENMIYQPNTGRYIKNNLFRFITLRAPELKEEESLGNRFVNYPENLNSESVFLKEFEPSNNQPKSDNTTRGEIIQSAVQDFESDAFIARDEVKDLVGEDFFSFAIWLTKNRTRLSTEETQAKAAGVNLLSDEQRVTIWDNLFYQIVTYKSNYVRDALFLVLVADFFLQKKGEVKTTDAAYQRLASARVIVPKMLFKNEAVLNNNTSNSIGLSSSSLGKVAQRIVLEETLNYYQKIKKELENAKTDHDKKESTRYKQELKAYEAKVEKAYAEARVDERPGRRSEDDEDEYVDLQLPEKYEFTPSKQLDEKDLEQSISPETLDYIKQLTANRNFDSFNEVIICVEKDISRTTQQLFEVSELSQKVIHYNGAVLQTNNIPVPDYSVSVYGNNIGGLVLTFSDDFNNAGVVEAEYTVTIGGQPILGTGFSDFINSGRLAVKLTGLSIDYNSSSYLSIQGFFKLDDGTKIVFTIKRARIHTDNEPKGGFIHTVNGVGTYLLEFSSEDGDDGTGNGDGNGDENGDNNDDANTNDVVEYIPSGFGIKRLGIADYRRVEQTVCCYVPGEVSHIENIMAREYKERETRRLRRKEDTVTTSTETEIEKLTDTTSTDRFEMNQEVASVIAEDQQIGAYASATYSPTGNATFSAGADYSTSTSSEQSNSQAVTYAKEVTERALDRVVTKIKEERIVKIIEEFEDTNKHGYDNREGDEHISGVYRWVDKVYKNQVFNYGKRLMYEFMIPEPAAFHNAAIQGESNSDEEVLEKPIDPRTIEGVLNLSDHSKITEATYTHWAGVYNAEIEPITKEYIQISKAFKVEFMDNGQEGNSISDKVDIPEGYEAYKFKVSGGNYAHGDNTEHASILIGVGNAEPIYSFASRLNTNEIPLNYIQKELGVSAATFDTLTTGFVVYVRCKRTEEVYEKWQIDTFNTIISAYEERLAEFNSRVAEIKEYGVNPGFYRQIENMVLRKNCIAYLVSNPNMGDNFIDHREDIKDVTVNFQNAALETYAARVKFFEQAFEWDIMSYNFYPFYWADRSQWKEKYNVTEFNDPLHRSFLQSGMARVVVTVRPGFEEVVNWYMATGQIWNGGEVPTMDDELFMSIVDELQEPEYAIEETWESRVPTSLTVIQAGTVGLNVDGLPCNSDCEDFRLFDSDGNEITDENGESYTNPIIGTNNKLTAKDSDSNNTSSSSGVGAQK